MMVSSPQKRSGRSKHHDSILSSRRACTSQDSLASGSGTPPVKPKQVEVLFEVEAETTFGSEVRVVGDPEALGAWTPQAGVMLQTWPEKYPLWSARVNIPVVPGGEQFEYKFVVILPNGTTLWEEGSNRSLRLCLQTTSIASEKTAKEFSGVVNVASTPWSGLPPPPVPKGDTVTWRVVCAVTDPGDKLFVTGSSRELGDWSASAGLQLHTSPSLYPVWYGTKEMGQGRPAWKLAIIRADGSQDWEDGENRVLNAPVSTPGSIRGWCVHMAFNGPHEITEVAPTSPDGPSQSPRTVSPSKVNSPQTSVGSNIPRDDSSISTIASDWEDYANSESQGTESWPRPPAWRLNTGAHQLHKPGGRCEDAFFCSPQALGVADGVGQMSYFSKYGVDSAAYATGLMHRASAALCPGSSVAKIDDTIERASAAIRCAESEVESYGASTICVLCLEGNTAGIANLGDSGFMLLRKNEDGEMAIVTKSEEQQHGWNFPFQLMRIPPALQAKVPRGRRFDTADDCERYTVELMAGDLLLLYTDGLADNLHKSEILEIVNHYVRAPEHAPTGTSANAEAISRAVAHRAQECSLDENAEVPFNVVARQYGHEFTGGKADDITVVAAWVGFEA